MTRMVVVASIVLWVGSARADVLTQPSGAAIPSPMGCDGGQPTGLAAVLACECSGGSACNIGPPCASPGSCAMPTGACETTLWHAFNDNTCIPSNLGGLDPYTDGSLSPETFTPTCALTFTLVTRGTARFRDVFGWYNVASPEDLFPMLDCATVAGAEVTLDVRGDPRWTGGEIGFFIVTPEQHGASGQCAGGDCCASVERLDTAGHVFYSQRALNPDASVVHLVIYDSVLAERKFYFAWEDIFGGSNNDFTDLVTSVSGVECSGGGAACDTGVPGLCAYGITACTGSAIACQQVYDAAPEVCDGADNDCDGMVDEDACSDDVTANCTGVSCPEGEVCRGGACVDPCTNVACPAGQACLSGVCLAGCNQCNGAVCPASKSCDLDTGACVGGGDVASPDAGPGAGGDDDGAGAPVGGCGCQGGGGGASLLLVLLALPRRRRPAPGRGR